MLIDPVDTRLFLELIGPSCQAHLRWAHLKVDLLWATVFQGCAAMEFLGSHNAARPHAHEEKSRQYMRGDISLEIGAKCPHPRQHGKKPHLRLR